MTTVIERLRVQGGAAPGGPSNFIRSHSSRLSVRRAPAKKVNSDISEQGRLYTGPSPMVRRMDIASAYKEINSTLPTMDMLHPHHQDSDTASKVSFVLSGKGVSDSASVRSAIIGPRLTRAGSYKTTPREQYCVTHGVSLKDGSEPLPFGHGIHACFERDLDDFSRSSLRTAKSTRSQSEHSGQKSVGSLGNNFVTAPPSTAATSIHPRPVTSLELTGQRYLNQTTDEFAFYDSNILDNSCFPYLRSPRRSFRFPNFNQPCPGDPLPQLQDLHECLTIHKTAPPGSKRQDGHNDNSKSNKGNQKHNLDDIKKNLRRYEFTNLASYLQFNRPNHKGRVEVAEKPRLTHIPRGVISLPEPWAESVLKLMTDLRPLGSRMSQCSEFGNHDEQDEFFVVGPPTSFDKLPYKSPATMRKNQLKSKCATGSKAGVAIKEETAVVTNDIVETAIQDTARSDSSVDPNDLQHQIELSETVEPSIAVSVTVAQGETSKQNTTSLSDKREGLKKEDRIIVPDGNNMCAEKDVKSPSNQNQMTNNDS